MFERNISIPMKWDTNAEKFHMDFENFSVASDFMNNEASAVYMPHCD